MLEEIGGLPALRRMTDLFYKKMFVDSVLDQYVLRKGTLLRPA